MDVLTWRLEVCGLREEDSVPEKGGKDRGGGCGCRGVENGVEEELPVVNKTNSQYQSLNRCTDNLPDLTALWTLQFGVL